MLRLLTTSAVTAPYGLKPFSNREALEAMDVMLADPRIGYAEEPEGLYEVWRKFADLAQSSPKLWMDAYLAAFSVRADLTMITLDKTFSKFKGLNYRLME